MLDEIRTILQLQFLPAAVVLPSRFDIPEVRGWLDDVGKVDVQIDWSAEWLTLYGTETLLDRQVGYSGPSDKRDQAWPVSWLVIGDVHADPIVFDTAHGSKRILFGRHGQGSWTLHPLAKNFRVLSDALTIWCNLYYREYHKTILDNDYELLCTFKDDLENALKTVLQPDELATFMMAVVG
jgi:hypothetical protein